MLKSGVVRRVDLWSLFKMAFVLYATLGFICGLFYGMIIALVGSLGAMFDDLPGMGQFSGAIGIVVVPIIAMVYGVMGSIVVTIAGALYNLAARFVGGVKVSVDVSDASGTASTAGPAAI